MMFEAVAVVLAILLVFTMYMMIASSAPLVTEKWNTTAGGEPYLYAGDNGTLYVFNGNNITAIASAGSVRWSIAMPDSWTIVNEWSWYTPQNVTGFDLLSIDPISRSGAPYPGEVQNGYRPASAPAVASSGGILYVYARPSFHSEDAAYDGNVSYGLERAFGPGWCGSPSYARLMAISPDGSVLWDKPLDDGADKGLYGWLPVEDVFIYAQHDRIYVYHPDSLAVMDANGSFLFRIDNVSDPAAVDEYGNIYAVSASADAGSMKINPSDTVVAYDPNGTLRWQKVMAGPIQRQKLDASVNPVYWTLPIYRNGTLYVPLQKGLAALDRNGDELWSESFIWDVNLLWKMPFDSQNNAYLMVATQPIAGSDQVVYQGTMVTPDGKFADYSIQRDSASLISADNGIGYYVHPDSWIDGPTGTGTAPSGLNDLISLNITASDLKDDKVLWDFTIPDSNANVLTLNPSNVQHMDEMASGLSTVFGEYTMPGSAGTSAEYNKKHPELQHMSKDAIGPWEIAGAGAINVLPDDDAVYVSYYMYNYEYPASLEAPYCENETEASSDAYKYAHAAVFNRSELEYVSGILALDKNGKLLWNKPTGSIVTGMAANNSTVYYSTGDGRLYATGVDIAVGFAIAAAGYLFLRFFFIGAVARARDRLGKNVNRNSVYRYIVDHPGSTLREASRGLRMNLGTVRYHVLVLTLNHKLVSYMADDKHVRYFTNANSYTKAEQLVISMVRREGMRNILGLLLDRPGLTNVELSNRLGMRVSATSRYMKELSDKGIIAKRPLAGGACSYSIKKEQAERIASTIERLSNG